VIEPRDLDEIVEHIDEWSDMIDRYSSVRIMSDDHRLGHGCDAFPTSARGARLQSAIARLVRAGRILEVGCGLGYSALWYAEALPPDGLIETIDRDEMHVSIARGNFRREGFADRIRVLHGEAVEVVASLTGPYDLISVDADWREYPRLFDHFLRLLRADGVLISSNLFPGAHPVSVWGLKQVAAYRELLENDEDERFITAYVDSKAITLKH